MSIYTKAKLYNASAVEIYKMVLKGDEIKRFPDGFWKQSEAKENAAKCTRYLIEEILKYDKKILKDKISVALFVKNKLSGMLQICFNSSPYEAIDNAYPGVYKEWEFKFTKQAYWNDKENAKNATRWLIEEKLNLNEKQIKEKVCQKMFVEAGLGGMLGKCFNNSPYEAINAIYPNKFKEWEFKCTPKGYWKNKENGIKTVKWLIEEKLKLSDDEIKKQLSSKFFEKHGLKGMLKYSFSGSPYEAINTTYPNKFKEWEFRCTPKGYWKNKETSIKTVKWLVEEKLKLTDNDIRKQWGSKLFIDNGLRSMLRHCFNSSPYEALNSAYPNKFQKWELRYVSNRYWNNKENGIKATKWLIEEKLNLTETELIEIISFKWFKSYGLGGMLQYCFNGSPYEAINSVYPNKYKKSDFKSYKNNL